MSCLRQGDGGCFEGTAPFITAYCLASISSPVLISDAKEVELNWCWYLSGEVYFASLLVKAYAKYSITSTSSTTCWKVSVRMQARHGALM